MPGKKSIPVDEINPVGKDGLKKKVSVWEGDITQLEVTMIVNAANGSLLGGGGVDGAIHAAAGKQLVEACRPLKGCETGDAKVTPGFKLPSSFVAHTVGPVYSSHSPQEASRLLESCYSRCMDLVQLKAEEEGLDDVSIAFPSISCGVYGFPFRPAAEIAIKTVKKKLEKEKYSKISRVIFVTFSKGHEDEYNELVKELL